MQLEWFTLLTLPFVAIACWLYTVSVARSKFPKLRNKRICLLIAHPDDEAMFFAPTVLALTDPALGNHVKILCLSSGNAEGLGETRKKELVKSGMLLGLRKEDDVFVIDSPEFPDSMTTTWDKMKVASLLSAFFAPNLAKPMKNKSVDAPTATIDVLITFDESGVSSHLNHISLYHGARHFIASLIHNRPGWGCPVDLYTLNTVSLVRKYTSFFDSITSTLLIAFQPKQTGAHPSPLLFLSGPGEVGVGQKAMTTAHKSQIGWNMIGLVRYGWIGLSRYMFVNDLRLEKITTK